MRACLDTERPCTGILRELSVSLLEGKVGKLSGGLLFVGIDGFDVEYADRWATDWWEEIREDSVHCTVPCPEAIESGDIGTASSPRFVEQGVYRDASAQKRRAGFLGENDGRR